MAEGQGREGDRRGGRRAGRPGGRQRGDRDARRDERKAEALRHTAEMQERLGAEIARATKATRFYDAAPARPERPERANAAEAEGTEETAPAVPEVVVVDQDSVTAVLENGRGLASACDLAVLDFASFTYPGGGYDRGTMAQEESLCAESFLYNVLKGFGGWYGENRRRNINCELYRDRALVVPKVRFERDRFHSYADVIVAAAPNLRRARADYHVDDATLRRAMRGRIRLVLAIADVLGHDKLVLGAFGCGVFGWDAAVVAEILRDELASGAHVATKVILAVPKGRHDENLEHFQHAFAKFPEKNDEPYAPRPAEPVRSAKPADESDDEVEEDWRKYL